MANLARSMSNLHQRWISGAGSLAVIGLFALAYGFSAGVVLFATLWLFVPSMGEAAFMNWWALSAVLWLPMAISSAESLLRDIARRETEPQRERLKA